MNRDFDYIVELGSNFLAHYGVKGMKWRRRRNSQDPLTARRGKDTKDRRPNQRSGELNRRIRKRPNEKIIGRDKGAIDLARNTLQNVAYKQKQKDTRRGKRGSIKNAKKVHTAMSIIANAKKIIRGNK